jgi:hypothetical protein
MSCKINKENNFITFFFFILLPFINRDRPANGLFLCPPAFFQVLILRGKIRIGSFTHHGNSYPIIIFLSEYF